MRSTFLRSATRHFSVAHSLPTATGNTGIRGFVRKVAHGYAKQSTERPFLVAAITGGSTLSFADIFAQYVTRSEEKFSWNKSRTLGMLVFGTIWYGGPCKALYFGYDRFIGTGTALRAVYTSAIDCCLHTPFLLLPNYYLITGLIQGLSIKQIKGKLTGEWVTAASGMGAFWSPTMIINFLLVPQHSRTLFVGVASIVSGTWLSWHSNKGKDKEASEQKVVQAEDSTSLVAAVSLPYPLPLLIDHCQRYMVELAIAAAPLGTI